MFTVTKLWLKLGNIDVEKPWYMAWFVSKIFSESCANINYVDHIMQLKVNQGVIQICVK